MRKNVLPIIFLFVFIDLLGFGIMLPNLQLYGKRFGITSYVTLTLMGAIYSVFQFLFSPILGRWSDRIGRRPVLLLCQAGTLIGFLLLFVAHWFENGAGGGQATIGIILIFASRILDGITGGNISVAAACIADVTTPETRAKGMGIIGAAFGIGFVFGPAMGGLVARWAGLEWVPIASAFFSLTCLTLTYFLLPETLDPNNRVPTSELRRYTLSGLFKPLFRPVIGAMIAMAFINGIGFAGMEQTYSLLVYKRQFEPQYGALPEDLQAASDRAGELAGFYTGMLLLLVGIIIAAVQGFLIHRLTRKFGEARLVITGPILIAIGLYTIAIDLPRLLPSLPWWSGFAIGSTFMALGASLFNPSIQSLVSRHTPAHEQGEIMGDFQGMASLARAIGPILAGILFQYVAAGTIYQGAAPYYVSATLSLLVAIWAFSLRHRLRPPATPVSAESAFPVITTPSENLSNSK